MDVFCTAASQLGGRRRRARRWDRATAVATSPQSLQAAKLEKRALPEPFWYSGIGFLLGLAPGSHSRSGSDLWHKGARVALRPRDLREGKLLACSEKQETDTRKPIWRDTVSLVKVADIFATLIAFALPWSTSLVPIFVVAWIVAVAPTLDIKSFMQSLMRPVCALPIGLFALAVAGTLWSDSPWGERLYAVSPAAKLLILPLLIYHFERSTRGMWVLVAFLVSCTLLMVMSCIVAYEPRLALKSGAYYGVPVKNYIDQSQEFTLCAVALAYPILILLGQKRFTQAGLLAAVGLGLVINMAFVVVSKTALVTMPIMLLVIALVHLKRRNVVILVCAMFMFAGAAWASSPYLRARVETSLIEYELLHKEMDALTSISMRLEFWRKSLRFFAQAPIIGNGTGSTRGLFEHAAAGHIGAAAFVVANPHNQTLNVAVQWGLLGVVLLYSMWWVQLLLFRGDGLANSIGLLVVVQNFLTSLFNSHLFDFHEGWMYVLGVGIAGGMTLQLRSREGAAPVVERLKPFSAASNPANLRASDPAT